MRRRDVLGVASFGVFMEHPHLANTSDNRGLLQRLLEEPDLVTRVRELSPVELRAVIENVGLEDAGELIALVTIDQLEAVLDEDLWTNAEPGTQEVFSPERFRVWLEIMLDAGEEWTANRLGALSEDFVALGILHHSLVVDLDALALEMSERQSSDDELTEKALDSCLYVEIDEYRVIAKVDAGWDSIVTAILALDRYLPAVLRRVLARCTAISADYIDAGGGLFAVLTAELALEGDVASERDARRSRLGYVSPTDAQSFLRLAALESSASALDLPRDPITNAYFRERNQRRGTAQRHASRAGALGRQSRKVWASHLGKTHQAPIGESEAGLATIESPDALGASTSRLRDSMRWLSFTEPDAFALRQEELAFLTNVVIAGFGVNGRRCRTAEAAEIAVAVTNLGLELACEAQGASRQTILDSAGAGRLLASTTADRLFRIGWYALQKP